ncbi:hypothetical protein I79_016630 [Cricetulus griseus]|uniref:Uncharacterized protein n=1 Tax=Cricetulus griseus TaxID=10029 RepID=G3HZW6_CRIGR|nr:hypothetical protein I79_016630 [Cricetulus griseus]
MRSEFLHLATSEGRTVISANPGDRPPGGTYPSWSDLPVKWRHRSRQEILAGQ